MIIILRQINSQLICDRIWKRIEFRFEHLFSHRCYLITTCSHPFFKSNCMASGALSEEARAKLKLFLCDSSWPVSDRTTDWDDFFNFEPTSTGQVDYLLRSADQDTNIRMLNRDPQIKCLFVEYNTAMVFQLSGLNSGCSYSNCKT